MKNRGLAIGLVLLMMSLVALSCQSKKETAKVPQKDMRVVIQEFHNILRPLHHQAVPEKNVKAIKDSLNHLLTLGDSLEIVPIPKDWEDISDTLKILTHHLAESGNKLREAVKSDSDQEILNAFMEYHDAFKSIMITLIDKGKIKEEDHEQEGEKETEKEK